MTSISPAPIHNSANNIPSQTDRAGSPSVAGSNPTVALPSTRSYASATRPAVNLPQSASSSVTSGDQHARSASLNNRGPSIMAAPAPAVSSATPNGTPAPSDHSRKPSVTISSAGASGYAPNGGTLPSAGTRNSISFGQFDTSSENVGGAVNTSQHASQNSLAASQHNPRITTPAKSPSPIPNPPASGGLPPTGYQAQNGGQLHFGSINGPEGGAVPVSAPQGPGIPGQPVHLRRQSSQQSDVSNQSAPYTPGGAPNRNYQMQSQSRQRSFNAGGYNQQMPYSPAPGYRPMPGQQRPQGYPTQFQNQGYMGSPHPPRSPGFHPPGSQPGTPHVPHQQMYGGYGPQQQQQPPPYPAYHQHGGQNPESFGMQPGYSQSYQYYQQPYPMHPQYLGGQGPPTSPSPFRQAPPSSSQQYQQNRFNQSSQQMSRTSSHASTDRPTSSVGGPQQPPPSQTPTSNFRSHTPSQSTSARPPQSNFTIPKRESKAIQIKDASGNIISAKKAPSPANVPVKSPTPALTSVASSSESAAATPSPASTPGPSHTRSDSKTGMSAEEVRAKFLADVKKQSSGETISEEGAANASAEKEREIAPTGTAEPDNAQDTMKAMAEEKAAKDNRERERAEAAAEKDAAEARAAKDREVQAKAEADEAKAAGEKAASAAKKAEEAKAEEKTAAEATATGEDKPAGDAGQGLSEEDAEIERQIAEMEAADKAEEEREAAFAEKKRKENEERAAKEKAAAENADEEMKRAEREAEALEKKREEERDQPKEESADDKAEREKIFGADKPADESAAPEESAAPSGTATPASDDSMAPPKGQPASKVKPSPLKLDTAKSVEPPEPTPGMKSLKSARMLQIQGESVSYPDGIQSPNPALNQGSKRGGKVYDPAFLMQFADVFKEKPSVDWEQKLKETIGDTSEPQSAARSARTPATAGGKGLPRNAGPPAPAYQGMGTFGQQSRTLPPGTTSQDRFNASNSGSQRTMNNPLANYARPPGNFQMGQMMPPAGRNTSMGSMSSNAPRGGASRRGDSRRGPSAKELDKQNKSMPLTASGEVKGLELSKTGWKPTSIGNPGMGASAPDLSGHMAPDMVQKKVKSNLNKMTPSTFEKIADQILTIAAQSRDEADGRTLRQVIALTFEKACDEAHWAEMYAQFCFKMLGGISDDIKDENIVNKEGNPVSGGGLFRKYLLNRCQEEFERGWEVNLPDEKEGDKEEAAMLSDEYYVAAAAKRKGLGLIQFIGELFKLRMLSLKIMHQCFMRLLDFEGMPQESTIESLSKLVKTVGYTMDNQDANGSKMMDAYFERVQTILGMPNLPSRMHFMLLDVTDLRKNKWAEKGGTKGPKTIQEIHSEAAAQQAADAARQAQSRAQNRMPSGRGGPGGGFGGPMQPPTYDRNANVDSSDLRKLSQRRQETRQNSTNKPMGPGSMFQQRSASGRAGIGPGGAFARSSSGAGTQAGGGEKKEQVGGNAFAALAGMGDAEAEGKTPAASPRPGDATPAAAGREDPKPNGA